MTKREEEQLQKLLEKKKAAEKQEKKERAELDKLMKKYHGEKASEVVSERDELLALCDELLALRNTPKRGVEGMRNYVEYCRTHSYKNG